MEHTNLGVGCKISAAKCFWCEKKEGFDEFIADKKLI
jgi:hypothetical protein